MSLPPHNSYPGPPSPARAAPGVGKAALIGCAALFLLALIGGIVAVRTVKQQISHPAKTSFLGTAIVAAGAAAQGLLIQQAIVRYHAQHGIYPVSLITLVQEGSLDGKLLHNDLDDSPNPGHVSWRYTQPAEGASGGTPILEEPYHVTLGSRTQASRLVITLDGRSRSDTPPSDTP